MSNNPFPICESSNLNYNIVLIPLITIIDYGWFNLIMLDDINILFLIE